MELISTRIRRRLERDTTGATAFADFMVCLR